MAFDNERHQSGNEDSMHPMVPMIVRVYSDGSGTDVPVTPSTTCQDVIECCRDPGDESCQLVGVSDVHEEWPLKGEDRPLEILQHWSSTRRDSLRLVLRYTVLKRPPSSTNGGSVKLSNGMKEPGNVDEFVALPDGVQLTLLELREMACRQQHQIESQHQLLSAKEQRLRYLKEQEASHQLIAAENERLRRLRDRVEAQELKLRKLRALRGQVDQNKQSNVSLTSDLDTIRALFNEKEKELSMAVAKVDELTRQLEDIRRGMPSRDQAPSAAALELDKLRRELMYRNKLNEQQKVRLCQQREALTARQEEMGNIDKRISELQDRLHRKRVLNQQLANQISAASHKAQQPIRCGVMGGQPHQNGLPKQPSRGNIAAVEPFKHVPNIITADLPVKAELTKQTSNTVYQTSVHPADQLLVENGTKNEYEFGPSKSDPKYQTLPYNTKFTINVVAKQPAKTDQHSTDTTWSETDLANNNNLKAMTVHSTPLSVINKSLATPLKINGVQPTARAACRGQPVGAAVPPQQQQKPQVQQQKVPAVNTNKPSTIYQTSSTKILPVQPQTLQPSPQLVLSPPQGQSTPLSTPDTDSRTGKPALPPKPAIKPPPRQTQPAAEVEKESVEEPVDLPIKARPLTIKKQPLSEQPRLRASLQPKLNGYHVSINRRIEMPPAFLFPEMDNPPADLLGEPGRLPAGETAVETKEEPGNTEDRTSPCASEDKEEKTTTTDTDNVDNVVMRVKKGNLKGSGKANPSRRVSFDPLALLLDASLEGELELVKKTATQVPNPSAANDEGITALHNAICAGHLEIVKFLVEFGCDVNAQDSDGWTPLHCAASCNNVAMVRFLVEHGACIFATTLSDHETAAEKCEEDEEGFDGCSEYLYSVQEKLGILSAGAVYAVFDYTAQQQDELSFTAGQQITVLRKGDENEREWWWSRLNDNEGYIPRNLLGLYPRVASKTDQ
ncbi:Ankyrin-repeat SH3-domain and Proline-rich-region containing Protein [Carabus blaptoides fortunei]